MEKTKVAIVKNGKLKTSVEKTIELLGGLSSFVKRRGKIIIKPNICGGLYRHGDNCGAKVGTITNPFFVKGLIELLQEHGINDISIVDCDMVWNWCDQAIYESGYQKLAKGLGVEILNLSKTKRKLINIPNPQANEKLYFPEMIADSMKLDDVKIINCPIMKTHLLGGVSSGMKNLYGLLPERNKSIYHKKGLHNTIVDVNQVVKPVLTIMDGTFVGEGFGPMKNNILKLNLTMACQNTVSCDVAGLKIMKFPIEEVRHVKKGVELGLGVEEIKFVGSKISRLKIKMHQFPGSFWFWNNLTRFILWIPFTVGAGDETMEFEEAISRWWPFDKEMGWWTPELKIRKRRSEFSEEIEKISSSIREKFLERNHVKV